MGGIGGNFMKAQKSRRKFLKTAPALAAAAPLISRLPIARAESSKFDPAFGTASQAIQAIRNKVISSRELTEITFKRIQKYNPKINAFVTLIEEQAMAQAKQADELLAGKKATGKLHGLPILIKDTFMTAGVRTTVGSKYYANHVPTEDAVAVARYKQAGAVILGKTNLPEFAGDWQAYNQVAGTTNNPWDISRTPGGSTGGGAAAIAAGFGFLELGSDVGGSIRVPAHFCGVYGHKTTIDVVPFRGHIPPPPGALAPMELPVVGPLARSAEDLKLALEIIGGPAGYEATAYKWSLPAPRKNRLQDYRIGYVIDDSFCPLDSTAKNVMVDAIDALRKKGANLTEGWPKGVDPNKSYDCYMFLIGGSLTLGYPEALIKQMSELAKTGNAYAKGATASHREYMQQTEQRFRAREVWQNYFKSFDAFLLPTAFVPAFEHNHQGEIETRKMPTTEGVRDYADLSKWISFPILTGCPATIAPVGRTKSGLPVGIQIIGPYLEDATPIDIAMKMADVTGGFTAPPGFSD
jgi:amidase